MDTATNLQTDQAQTSQLAGVNAHQEAPSIGLKVIQRSALAWLPKTAIAIAAFALLFMIAGATYQSIVAKADARRFPQEGKSVGIGGFSLNINCTGQGSPTVVLEAGLGVPAISWRAVQREIGKFTRVCSL